jgi:signal transduction histidine kinase/ActR/RegA family two-component response regulator
MAIAVFLLLLSYIAWKAKLEFSFYYLISYSFAALTTLVYVAHKLALLPTNFATSYAIGYSILLQSIVLTSVLIERKKMEKKIIGFEGQAKVMPNSTRDWIAQFSHEIRTPLNGVIGMADLLKETPLNPTQYNYVRVLGSSGEHLIELVSDVLDFESLSSGEVELNIAAFDLASLCDDVFAMFKQQADENQVKLELELAEDMPLLYLGDAKRLKQILINLISNSIKFTHDGKIMLSARYKNDHLSLHVFDNGIGMTKQQQQGIFERFRQADQAIYAKYGGSGLGLAICRQLVQLMEGEIKVKSKLGEYTRFTLTLPLQPANSVLANLNNESVDVKEQPSISKIEPKTTNMVSLIGTELNILGVDDNEINRRVLNAMLKKLGHKMIAASSGQEAIDIIQSGASIDLILMDCEMPGMNGFEATQSIRQWQYGQAGRPCPIVALTAHILEEHKEKCLSVGMDDHLAKPLHLDDLKTVINKLEQGGFRGESI